MCLSLTLVSKNISVHPSLRHLGLAALLADLGVLGVLGLSVLLVGLGDCLLDLERSGGLALNTSISGDDVVLSRLVWICFEGVAFFRL